jgi:hypothetical protein
VEPEREDRTLRATLCCYYRNGHTAHPQQLDGRKRGDVRVEDESPFMLRVTGPVGTDVYRLSRGRTIVGRSRVGLPDVQIGELSAAGRHCVLDWDDASACHRLSVWGMNGVSVNGTLVLPEGDPRLLSAGDELLIGNTSLRYERSGAAEGPG